MKVLGEKNVIYTMLLTNSKTGSKHSCGTRLDWVQVFIFVYSLQFPPFSLC